MRNAYNNLIKNLNERIIWNNYIKLYHIKIFSDNVDWIFLALYRVHWQDLVNKV
jgi:hypothetical protein